MKTIFALATALFVGSAFAQQPNNPSHMFEFNADSVLQGVFSLDKSKVRGGTSDNDTQLNLNLNYAYALPQMRALQVGARLNYNKATDAGRGDYEDYSGEIGAIYNYSPGQQEPDLMNSYYASLYLGLGWANNYGGSELDQGRKDEVFSQTVALGKRFDLSNWGINHLTYTPEIALENLNSTTGSNLEYSQNIQFRFLQFAVFF
jgi:hypothetical protein